MGIISALIKRTMLLCGRLALLTALVAITILVFPLTFLTAHARDGTTESHTILVKGMERSYLIHLPTGYSKQDMLPLVIALHGGGGNPEQFAKDTGFTQKADKEDFIVVYPRGTGLLPTWDGIHCCGEAFNNKIDDVGFIRALINELISTRHVDPKRVYITGHSNGGFMTYRLGAELSDKIAAISVSAGTIGGKPRLRSPVVQIQDPATPVSVLAFHGKIDQHVLYDGGVTTKGLVVGPYDLSVAESIDFWVRANKCTATPTVKTTGQITVKDYTSCEQNTEVTLYTIADQGHAWPGGTTGAIDPPTKDISATDISWAFFKAHPKVTAQVESKSDFFDNVSSYNR